MKKKKRKGFWSVLLARKALLINMACFLLPAASAVFILESLKRSDHFSVRQVVIREKDDISINESAFDYFKGRNIFAIDLKAEAEKITRSYPSYRKVRLTRFLPDCVLVDFLRRKPVASIRGAGSLFIDGNGCVFDQPGNYDPSCLPSICGLEKKIRGLATGRYGKIREIALPVQVIQCFSRDRVLSDFRISSIDAGVPDNLSIVLRPSGRGTENARDEGIEVRVGAEGIAAKMQILSTVLTQMRSNFGNIKYIDLRFREPVIKFKNMEKLARK